MVPRKHSTARLVAFKRPVEPRVFHQPPKPRRAPPNPGAELALYPAARVEGQIFRWPGFKSRSSQIPPAFLPVDHSLIERMVCALQAWLCTFVGYPRAERYLQGWMVLDFRKID